MPSMMKKTGPWYYDLAHGPGVRVAGLAEIPGQDLGPLVRVGQTGRRNEGIVTIPMALHTPR
jgi:hypothetical protein